MQHDVFATKICLTSTTLAQFILETDNPSERIIHLVQKGFQKGIQSNHLKKKTLLMRSCTVCIKLFIAGLFYSSSDVPRVGNRFYCNHCNETVSKSTFYEHKAIYGSACGIPSYNEQEEVEVNLDSDSDNENLVLSWGDEDRQFFFRWLL